MPESTATRATLINQDLHCRRSTSFCLPRQHPSGVGLRGRVGNHGGHLPAPHYWQLPTVDGRGRKVGVGAVTVRNVSKVVFILALSSILLHGPSSRFRRRPCSCPSCLVFRVRKLRTALILSNTEVSQRDFSFAILTTLALRRYCLGICQRRSYQNPQSSATSFRVPGRVRATIYP
jgi:hypothetical protein